MKRSIKNMAMTLSLGALMFGAWACGAQGQSSSPSGEGELEERDSPKQTSAPALKQYTSKADGFSTSSFWVESEQGVVVFDAQFLPEYAEALMAEIAAQTSKPITDVVISHANPDKYNGLEVIRAKHPEVKIWATPQIVARIKEVDAGKKGFFGPQYGERYPQGLVLPDELISAPQVLRRGSLEIELIPMGAGVSTAHLVSLIKSSGELVVGDLLHNKTHGWLAEGFSQQWLERLDALERLGAKRFLPGRGAPGGAELIAQQRDYLKGFQACVASELEGAGQEADIATIKACILARFPDHQIEAMVDFSIPGELEAQRARLD